MKYFCSIIVPFKNAEKTISKCIQSVIKQDGDVKYEIIFIDDFSNDNSSIICRQAIKGKSNCKIIKSKLISVGPGHARNLGIKCAQGQYVFFVDSDDKIKKNTIKLLEKKIKEEKNPDLLCVNYKVIDEVGNFKKKYRFDLKFYKTTKKILLLNYFNLSLIPQVISNLIKKETINKHKIFFNRGYFEDVYFFFLILYYSKTIRIFTQKLYIKINRFNSIVNSLSERHINDSLTGYYRCQRFLLKKKFLNKLDLRKYFLIAITGQVAVFLKRISKETNLRKKLNLHKFLRKNYFKFQKKIRYNHYFVTKKDIIAKKFLYDKS